jgi:hypothetical protein
MSPRWISTSGLLLRDLLQQIDRDIGSGAPIRDQCDLCAGLQRDHLRANLSGANVGDGPELSVRPVITEVAYERSGPVFIARAEAEFTLESLHLGRVAGDLRVQQIVAQFGAIPGGLEDVRRSRKRNSGTLHLECPDLRRRADEVVLDARSDGKAQPAPGLAAGFGGGRL